MALVGTEAPGSNRRLEWNLLPLGSAIRLSWILTVSFCLCPCACTYLYTHVQWNEVPAGPLNAAIPVEKGEASNCEGLAPERLTRIPPPALVPQCHGKAASSSLDGSLAGVAMCSPACGSWVWMGE